MFDLFRRQQTAQDHEPVLCLPPHGSIQLAEGDTVAEWEVAKPGIWHAFIGGRVELGAEDLEQIAQAYDPKFLKGAINLDHQYFGRSHGWIRRAQFRAGSLWVQVERLSRDLVDLIRDGGYERASAEIKPVSLGDGRQIMYLRGVAVLGNADPAITGMAPIAASGQHAVLIHLTAEPPTEAPADPTATPGQEPPADPPQEPSEAEEEGDPTMKPEDANEGTEGQPGADPAAPAEPQTPSAPATPPAGSDPNHAALAARRREIDEELRLARESRQRIAAAEAEVRQERAESRVDRDLQALGGRITPAEIRTLRPLLVSLAAAETPTTVHLAAPTDDDPNATREVPQYEALLATYRNRPDHLAALSQELAGEDGDPPTHDPRDVRTKQFHAAAGLDEQRLQQLAAKYGHEAIYGPRGNRAN